MTTVISQHRRGDTWLGLGPITVTINSVPLDLTGASIRMQIRKQKAFPTFAYEWSTAENSVTISDAPNGVFSIDATVMNVDAANYYYDIEITTSSGRILTVVEGTWEIVEDVTR